ncbi:MAG: hypothetical protein ACYCXZ_06675 [Coriobacteriia bacterium]
MRRGPYTYGEEQTIVVLAPLGQHAVAFILDRDVRCVKRKASRMHVSLRKRVQINVTSLSPRMLDAIKSHNPDALCPACGKRLVATRDGLCGACHLEALTDNHNAEYAKLAAKKPYDVSKQQLKRLRKDLGVSAPRSRGGDATA